jgi:hypothetical protein
MTPEYRWPPQIGRTARDIVNGALMVRILAILATAKHRR